MKFISIFILSLSLFYSSTTYGSHLRNKSNAEALGTHKARLGEFTNQFQKEIILPSAHPKALKNTSKPNAKIQDIMSKSDLLSVLFYDGNSITVNELSSKKLKKSDKMYSMSIAKSYVGYLVGHAICDGSIKSLSDPIDMYVPETTGTLYEGVSIQNMINMTAGDRDYYGGGSNTIAEYAVPILGEKKTIKSMLDATSGVSHLKNTDFRYSNIVTDLVARAIHLTSPSGIKDYYHKKISNPANYHSGMFYFKDKNGWGIHFAFLYAAREDYLKFAKLIVQDWRSNNCIGSYLRQLYAKRVPTRKITNGFNYQSYGGFFWMDKENLSFPHLSMSGHGGQRITINLKTGAVLSTHAIRENFDYRRIERMFFN